MIRHAIFAVGVIGLIAGSKASAENEWTLPEPVTGAPPVSYAPSSAVGGLHELDVVYIGQDRQMYHQWKDSTGILTAPLPVGDVNTAAQPSLVANGQHKLDLFYRGPDGHLWTRWHDGQTWSPPTSLGGLALTSAPYAVTNGLHRLDVFYAGPDGKPHMSWWDGGTWWSAPEKISEETMMLLPRPANMPPSIPWKMRYPPAAVTGGPHKVDVIYLVPVAGQDYGALRTVWSEGINSTFTGNWSVPMNLNGWKPGTVKPAKVSFSDRIASSVGAVSFVTSEGKRSSRLYFTAATQTDGNKLQYVYSTAGADWFNSTGTTVFSGYSVAAMTPEDVFFVDKRLSATDKDHIAGLVRTCRVKNALSGPDKLATCLQLPPPQ